MERTVFPCIICDHLIGDTCEADIRQRKVWETDSCPLGLQSKGKPDVGRWVVTQPDGKLCYYDEGKGRILARDLTLEEMCLYRRDNFSMNYDHAEQDTLLQLQFRPCKWEDIPDFVKKG